jgi:4-hydroxy-tetrahydrodipicolinate synthase
MKTARRQRVVAVSKLTPENVLDTELRAERLIHALGADATALRPELPIRRRKGHLVITDRYPGFVHHQLVELGYLKSAHSSTADSVAFNVQPRATGQLLIGSSRQYGAEHSEVDQNILTAMLARTARYLAAASSLSAIRVWTGFRAATPDKLPLIGPVPGDSTLWLAAGHEGLGITTSLATAELLACAFTGTAPAISPEPYLPSRFGLSTLPSSTSPTTITYDHREIMNWTGVLPAMTTAFAPDFTVDHPAVARHAQWLIENGCTGIICLGSLGEASTLSLDEKNQVLKTVAAALGGKAPVVAAISALSTAEAVEAARAAHAAGCSRLMILPPYVYKGDWRENKAHVAAVLKATPLPAMLYNNPAAYGVDFLPEQIAELAREFPNLAAVKESSTDVRRVTAIRALLGDRLSVLVGVDDLIVEGIAAGAAGWVAGLVNALPRESVDLFRLASGGKTDQAFELYRWFLPLLRMDTIPKFIQYIKQVGQEAGIYSARVRAPRLEPVGGELAEIRAAFDFAQAHRPSIARASTPFTL